MRTRKIVIAGAGIVGSILAERLRGLQCCEVITLERSLPGEHEGAGTGLNIGPNAVKALREFLPQTAVQLEQRGLPWREWRIALTDGRELMRLNLQDVADNEGLRLRWSEIYQVLREPIWDAIKFGTELVSARYARGNEEGPVTVEVRDRTTGRITVIQGVDLLIGTDGRYSKVRDAFFEPSLPRYLGVAMYRLLIKRDAASLIDDYVQYFNGPNRLLAYRVPGGAVYLSGSFPIMPEAQVAERQKTPEALISLYKPREGKLCAGVKFLLDAVEAAPDEIHWSRLQHEESAYDDGRGHVLLLGDAAHPMVPTLGQGAAQSIEDACVAQQEILSQDTFAAAIRAIVELRARRVDEVAALSWEASDTMQPKISKLVVH